ncbi:hypothetical protein [Sphingobium sp. IP1]|uniref:hypothetical protein n=1 Tax=Sphingobium sp. IP1 TaxID=2021637 RepID=UPI0015D4D2EE|nr:hypothetical protein [Sphingobium sp. IP1]
MIMLHYDIKHFLPLFQATEYPTRVIKCMDSSSLESDTMRMKPIRHDIFASSGYFPD